MQQSPREELRSYLNVRLHGLIDGAYQHVDVDAPLDPANPGLRDPDGEPAKLWQKVPVITKRDLVAALDVVFGERLPSASNKTADVMTPATVYVAAVCPRCQVAQRIPLTIGVELHQDDSGETLHLKGKSKPAIHLCGQQELPESKEAVGQEEIAWDQTTEQGEPEAPELIGPRLLGAGDVVEGEFSEPVEHSPIDEPMVGIEVGEGETATIASDEQVTQEDLAVEADLGADEPEKCPFPGCVAEAEHAGPHTSPGPEPDWAALDLLPF